MKAARALNFLSSLPVSSSLTFLSLLSLSNSYVVSFTSFLVLTSVQTDDIWFLLPKIILCVFGTLRHEPVSEFVRDTLKLLPLLLLQR
jgi:hypothetical protein